MTATAARFEKQVTARTNAVMGTMFCHSGHHHVPADRIARTKHPAACKACMERIAAARKVAKGRSK